LINNSKHFGYIGIVLAILGWGLSASFIGFGLGFVNPFLFLFLRFFSAVIILSPYIMLYKRKAFRQLITNKWTWIISFFEFAGLELQYIGQQSVSASLTTLLVIQFVIFVPILSAKFFQISISKINVIAIGVALLGSIFISTEGKITDIFTNINIGVIFLILSSLAYSFYLIASSHFSNKSNNTFDTSVLFFIIILGITLFSFIPALITSYPYSIDSSVWYWVILLAVFSTIIPFFGYFLGLKVISANTMSLVLLLQLVVPFMIDILFLGINYSFWIIIGILLIVSSLFIFVSKPLLDKYKLEKYNYKSIHQIKKSQIL
jgi:drug/metabolite transporter (DMT)-like permease